MTSSETHLFEQIAESLRIRIARGELQAGDRLPSIRETAELWQCTPGTVSRAYAILADERLVTSRRGGGTVVNENTILEDREALGSARLTNQLESVVLNLVGQGYTEDEIDSAFALALARWRSWQKKARDGDVLHLENQLNFVGSHDLAVEHLAHELAKGGNCRLRTTYRGSLGGLMALARREADIAGSHLWDEESDQYNVPFIQRILPGERVALVTLAGRSFGLMLPADNPQAVENLNDLTMEGVRWVNRQPGSGTRVWLDAQLKKLGVNTAGIEGYEDARTTHSEVAEAINNGEATAGLGIEAAAKAHGLDFIPLAEEQYQLVIPQRVLDSALCQDLLDLIRSREFKETVVGFGGYETAETGNIIWIG
jgi:molybdate-binding protein/DNA-binding transcriptional regulator YhcF (GntR family)